MDKNSWFTPQVYINAVIEVLGEIDLDPFSCEEANEIVRARNFFSKHKSAYDHDWIADSVFMNSPYGRGEIDNAIHRFISERNRWNFQSIVLTNNITETRAGQKLLSNCNAICFPNHRIKFWCSDNKRESSNNKAQMFTYFGNHPEVFKQVFSKFGQCF